MYKIPKRNKGQNKHTSDSKAQIKALSHVRSVPTWNKKKFMLVAKDRGYLTERAVVYAVAEALGLSRNVTQTMLSNGRIKWEQMLVIGSFLEMTPKEFCDIFLSGLFVEDGQGHYKCHVDNAEMLLRPPKVKDSKTKAQIESEQRQEIIDELGVITADLFKNMGE